jgi:hypothetical protein
MNYCPCCGYIYIEDKDVFHFALTIIEFFARSTKLRTKTLNLAKNDDAYVKTNLLRKAHYYRMMGYPFRTKIGVIIVLFKI